MVRPARVTTAVAVADLHADPRADSELVDQSGYGEHLAVLGERGDWLWVQGEDGYLGWIARAAVDALPPPVGEAQVAVLLAEVRALPDPAAPPVALLPLGAALVASQRQGGWAKMPLGWVSLADLAVPEQLPQRPPTAADLIASARPFLGTPYRWGGTTAAGIDCSGFVQQVYRLNGVGLDRDADQQALGGFAVDVPIAGDLLFFGSPRVTHVAMSLGGDDFIHAPQRGGMVEERKVGGDRVPVAVRRYLQEAW